MSGCILHVLGESFDPESYLNATGLLVYESFRRGEQRFPVRDGQKPRQYKYGGFKCEVSSKGGDNFPGQVDDAIDFLKRNKQTLLSLQSCPSVETKTLDFGLDLRIMDHNHAQFDYLPPKLLLLCGQLGIGIEMSIYPLDRSSFQKVKMT